MSDDRDERPTEPMPAIPPPAPQFQEDEVADAVPPATLHHLMRDEADPAPATNDMQPPPVVLVEVSGRGDGRGTLVTGDTATIGRTGDTLTLALTHDAWVSKEHARLRYHDAGWWLEDLVSKNGTWLDGTVVTAPTLVRPNQVIRVGHSEILLSDDLALATPQLHSI